MNILCITKCPTGMVQTYVAAERLEKTGEALGHQVAVETHGSSGIQKEFTPAQIDAADYVIISADTVVGENVRFGNKKIVITSLNDAIIHSDEIFNSLEARSLSYEEAKAKYKKIFG